MHDARAGDIRDVAQPCAGVLVRLGKAEYIIVRRPAGQKKKRDVGYGERETLYGEPEKTRNQDAIQKRQAGSACFRRWLSLLPVPGSRV